MTQKEVNKLILVMYGVVVALYAGFFVGYFTYKVPEPKTAPMCVFPIMSCPVKK